MEKLSDDKSVQCFKSLNRLDKTNILQLTMYT